MEVHGDLDLLGNKLKNAGIASANFPANPTEGDLSFNNGVLYICASNFGLPVWVPLTKSLNMVRYVQTAPSSDWIIAHSLNTSNILVQVYDNTGNWILPNGINTGTLNQVSITFNTPQAGVAILLRGEVDGNAFPLIAYQQSFTNSSTWVITHNLGYNPTIQTYVNNQLVEPASLTYDTLNQATATFSSPQTGYAICV